jgi:hypothetical protein
MIFLIDHERATGRTLLFKSYDESQRATAQDDRLQLELRLGREHVLLKREVVLLEASDEKALWRTHERYLRNLPKSADDNIS